MSQKIITLTTAIDEASTEFDVLQEILEEIEGHMFVCDGSVKVEVKEEC